MSDRPPFDPAPPDRALRLASGSAIRLALLTAAGLAVTATPARVDEAAARDALQAEGATPRDLADALAEMKALRVAQRHPKDLVLGCDQVLAFHGECWGKPADLAHLRAQLATLRGQTHQLISALVLYDQGQPVWRHADVARLTMRAVSDAYLDAYVARNGANLLDTVGGYKLEGEGVRLFSVIEGDYFTILGLPLLPLLNYLALRGFIAT